MWRLLFLSLLLTVGEDVSNATSTGAVVFTIEAASNYSAEGLEFFQQATLMPLEYLHISSMAGSALINNAVINIFSSGHVVTALDTTNATGEPVTVDEFSASLANISTLDWSGIITGHVSGQGVSTEVDISAALLKVQHQILAISNASIEVVDGAGGDGSGFDFSGNESESSGSFQNETHVSSYERTPVSCVFLAHSQVNVTESDVSLSAAIRQVGELFVVASVNTTTDPSALVKLTGNSRSHVYLISNSSEIGNTSEVLLSVSSSGELLCIKICDICSSSKILLSCFPFYVKL